MTARRLFALIIALCLSVSGMLAVRAAERPGNGSTAAAPNNSTTTMVTIPDPASTTTTWEPMPRPTDAPPPTTDGGGGSTTTVPVGDGDGNPPPGAPRTVPPGAQRQIDSVPRSGPNNTSVLMDVLQPLVDEFGLTESEAWVIGFGRFPVAGPASFVHDWRNARYTPSFHLHEGTDIFATVGTPVRAPFDGVLRHGDGGAGGMSSYVTMPDGTFAYMAHLAAWVPGQSSGMKVKQGDVVGFVGNTGNAQGGSHHCHFELHPKGGEAVDPKPYLDQWIADAIVQAPLLIDAYRAAKNGTPVGALPAASVSDSDFTLTPPVTAPRTPGPETLWAASANPAAGTLDLASSVVSGAAAAMRWGDGRNTVDKLAGQARGAAVVGPLYPPAFRSA